MSEHNFMAEGTWFKASWNAWEKKLTIWQNDSCNEKVSITIDKKDLLKIAGQILTELD